MPWGYTIRHFSSKEFACAVRQPGPCVRALCEAVAQNAKKTFSSQRLQCLATNLLHYGPQNKIQKTSRNREAIKGPRLYKQQVGTDREKKACVEPTLMLMLERRKICLQNFRGQQQNSPMAHPTFGSKSGPQNGAQGKTHEKKKACVEPTLMLMLERRKICLQTFRGQQQNSPMADPTFGSKSGPQNGAQAKTHEKKVK